MNILQITKEENGEIAARIPICLFNISLGIGTVFLFLGLAFPDCESIIISGFIYLIISFVINAIAFVSLMVLSFVFTTHSNAIRANTLLLLINIPIAILYIYLVVNNITSSSPY